MSDPLDPNCTNDSGDQSVISPEQALLLAKIRYAQQMADIQINNSRWKTRKHMAWIALGMIIGFTALMVRYVKPSDLSQLGNIISWFYISMTAVVAGYLGSDAFTYVASLKSGSLFPSNNPYGPPNNPYGPYNGYNTPVPASNTTPVRMRTSRAQQSTPFDAMDAEVATYTAQKKEPATKPVPESKPTNL